MSKTNFLIFLISPLVLALMTCPLSGIAEGGNSSSESPTPPYTAKIAWVSDMTDAATGFIQEDNGEIYLFECTFELSYLRNESRLIKLDAETGGVLWRSGPMELPGCIPVILESYVYVFFPNRSYILCFDRQTGELKAKAVVDIAGQSLTASRNFVEHGGYLYFGIGNNSVNNYFTRFNAGAIKKDGGLSVQTIEAEVLWRPKYDWSIDAKPVVHDNIIYAHTIAAEGDPVELVGINLDSREIVFDREMGLDNNGEYYDQGVNLDHNSLFIYDNILYYINHSISAYDLKNRHKQLFLKTFSGNMPPIKVYSASHHLDVTYHNKKIYYTTIFKNDYEADPYRNIYCIDAVTGNLVWSDIPRPVSESLGTNPVIAHGRMYVPHGFGLRVYEPDTGKLVGLDSSFCGSGRGRNILYKDYMITSLEDEYGNSRIVAIDISRQGEKL